MIFPRKIEVWSFVADYLFNIEKFLYSGPSLRSEVLASAARELSTVYSCTSSCGNVSVGDEEQSYWSLNTLISFAFGLSAGKHVDRCAVLCCRRRQTHGVAPKKTRWWTNGGPIWYLETLLMWIMWTVM